MKKILIIFMLVLMTLGFAQTELENGQAWGAQRQAINANFDELYEKVLVYAYIDTPAVTYLDTADVWYKLESSFNNDIVFNFTVAEDGITMTADTCYVFVKAMTGGNADKSCTLTLGIWKNCTFAEDGRKLTGTQISGCNGAVELTLVATATGFANPRADCIGLSHTNDKYSILVKASVDDVEWTPIGGHASIFKIA